MKECSHSKSILDELELVLKIIKISKTSQEKIQITTNKYDAKDAKV
jgi:hypothetical protein